MERIQRILVATDFSVRADRAVRRAAKLAAEHEAELYLLHVLPSLPFEAFKRLMVDTPLETEQRLYDQAKAALQKKAQMLAAEGVNVKYHVAIGSAHTEINQYAKSRQADLIVIGDQGETFIQEFFFGTTASKTLIKGRYPLLIVKQESEHSYRCVLVPVDFSLPSGLALQIALKVVPTGASTEVSIHALHVVDDAKIHQRGLDAVTLELHRNQVLSQVRRDLEKTVSGYATSDHRITPMIEYGSPPDVIRKKALFLGSDLIVIGKRGETELDEALFESVTKHVLFETPCDVLVVSPEQ